MSVAVVEYGAGNLGSVVHGCRRAGGEPIVVTNGAELRANTWSHIVLPGVGAIGVALRNLHQRGLDDALAACVFDQGIPFLGICVGMQMLAEECEEFGTHRGLGWIPGRVRRLAEKGSGLRLPHVGWNDITPDDDPIFATIDDHHFYFVHSYVLDCPDQYVIARCTYGSEFACAVRVGRIVAVQFHPEKSSATGVAVLRAFLNT